MKNKILFLCLAASLLAGCKAQKDEWAALNDQARAEYLEPIRPGGVDGSPFWNVYSYRFLYTPSFDFAEVEGADKYLFSVFSNQGTNLAEFKADSPKALLTPIWEKIAPGEYVTLVVNALDAAGNVIGEAGRREFLRDIPFHGPYPGPARDYREAAIKGLTYVHNLPCVRAWAEGRGPDMSYSMNSYVCKIIGATVRIECFLAANVANLHDDAMAVANAAARYLVDNCRSEALEGWPPTYGKRPDTRGDYVDQVVMNSDGKTMTEEATVVGEAFLDMFNATADSVWFERSLRVARTYARLQDENGAWPVKYYYATGEPACPTRMFPFHILYYLRRLNTEFGLTEFEPVRLKAEKYVRDFIAPSFDMTGQFEDNGCDWTDPYSNLTNITGSGYAAYILKNGDVCEEDARNAIDMLKVSEDQFTHWDTYPEADGFKRTIAPCVHEQRAYEEAIDDSAANVAEGFMSLYEYNGDRLALEKAKALLSSITRAQNPVSGRIPTVTAYNGGYDETVFDLWLNCSWWSAMALLRMDEIINAE